MTAVDSVDEACAKLAAGSTKVGFDIVLTEVRESLGAGERGVHVLWARILSPRTQALAFALSMLWPFARLQAPLVYSFGLFGILNIERCMVGPLMLVL